MVTKEIRRTKYCPKVKRAVTILLEVGILPLRPSFSPVNQKFECDTNAICGIQVNQLDRPRVELDLCPLLPRQEKNHGAKTSP